MEKISLVLDVDNPEEDLYYCACRHIDCDHTGEWYSAADVDALLMKIANVIGSPKDVGRLPEALKYVLSSYRYRCEKTEAKHDALLADVRRMVEAVKNVENTIDILNGMRPDAVSPERRLIAWSAVFSACDIQKQAIAAVERHLLKE